MVVLTRYGRGEPLVCRRAVEAVRALLPDLTAEELQRLKLADIPAAQRAIPAVDVGSVPGPAGKPYRRHTAKKTDAPAEATP